MRSKIKRLVCALLVLGVLTGCGDSNDPVMQECPVEVVYDGQSIISCADNPNDTTVVLTRQQDEFIWQAMNLYYVWQEDIVNLSDGRFENYDELHEFLNSYSNSEELFEDLLLTEDRFSLIVDDYVALEQTLQGVSKSFGFDFRLLRVSEGSNDLFGFVKYVVPGGPADVAGLTRGTLFDRVDGEGIRDDNFAELLFDRNSFQLSLAELQADQITSTNDVRTLVSVELEENPIHLSKVLEIEGTQVGYLMYNQFVNNNRSHRELNEVFGTFKNMGVTELVLDLRYNPGGSLTTSSLLASMIYGNANATSNFGFLIFNSKLSSYFSNTLNFYESLPIFDETGEVIAVETLNRLSNLTRVFVLTSGDTSSASELLIVGLAPYLDVITVGTKTEGKNVASAILYDSKTSLFRRSENAEISQDHTYAIQPIVSLVANSEGFSEYSDGLEPDVVIDEKNFLSDLRPLGDLNEALLEEVVKVLGGPARELPKNDLFGHFVYLDPSEEILRQAIVDLQKH